MRKVGTNVYVDDPHETWIHGAKPIAETAGGLSYNSYRQPDRAPYSDGRWRSDAIPLFQDRNAKPWIIQDDSSSRLVTSVDQPRDESYGRRICASLGAGSFEIRCGTVQGLWTKVQGGGGGHDTWDQHYASFACGSGDSGSPIFVAQGGGHARAVGVVTAVRGGGNNCVYSHLPLVNTETNFRADSG